MDDSIQTALTSLHQEFDRALRFHGPLFHECLDSTFSTSQMSPEAWASFIEANQDSSSWERWEVDPNGCTCHRFTGAKSGLQEFQQLAESLHLVMCEIEPTLDPNRCHYGCIDVMYDTALAWPTPLLREQPRLWGHDTDQLPEPDEFERLVELQSSADHSTAYVLHPYCRSLVHNVFTSAMALIDLIVFPESTLLIGDYIDDPPVMTEPADEEIAEYDASVKYGADYEESDELTCVFQKQGQVRVIGFAVNEGNPPKTVSNSVGMDRLSVFLENEGRVFLPLELVKRSAPPKRNVSAQQETSRHQEIVDAQAKDDIERTIATLDSEIISLREAGGRIDDTDDIDDIDEMEVKRDELKVYLRKSTFRGKSRSFTQPLPEEKARKAVSKSISEALAILRQHTPDLADHLEEHTKYRDGQWRYQPPQPVKWIL